MTKVIAGHFFANNLMQDCPKRLQSPTLLRVHRNKQTLIFAFIAVHHYSKMCTVPKNPYIQLSIVLSLICSLFKYACL